MTGQYLAYAALFVGYGLDRLGSLVVTPQWIAFLAMSRHGADRAEISRGTTGPSSPLHDPS